jgi:hypothetical protein
MKMDRGKRKKDKKQVKRDRSVLFNMQVEQGDK